MKSWCQDLRMLIALFAHRSSQGELTEVKCFEKEMLADCEMHALMLGHGQVETFGLWGQVSKKV